MNYATRKSPVVSTASGELIGNSVKLTCCAEFNLLFIAWLTRIVSNNFLSRILLVSFIVCIVHVTMNNLRWRILNVLIRAKHCGCFRSSDLMALERFTLSSGRCRRAQRGGIDRYEGFAGFAATKLELPVSLPARENFEKPRCPQIPLDTIVGRSRSAETKQQHRK